MSHLHSVRIQGVRSFGPKDSDHGLMRFVETVKDANGETHAKAVPLTLIVGQNGCGKTTIIESLRYATTGDFPPGSNSGKSFIHDPKMAQESVVHASVKLKYTDGKGDVHTISRAVNATQKATAVTIKSVDAFIKSGEDMHTHKHANINEMAWEQLGVSKAILNNVIFCHQEDSTWPLDEGSKVKEKFDDIFSATKYQDCLKTMRDLCKRQQEVLKLDKTKVDFLRSDRQEMRDKKNQLHSRKADVDEIQEKLANYERNLMPMKEKLREFNEIEQNFQGINAKKTEAETKIQEYQRITRVIESKLGFQRLKQSEAEIEAMIEQLDEERKAKEKELGTIEGRIKDLEEAKDEADRESRVMAAKLGETEQRKRDHKANQSSLESRRRQILQDYAHMDLAEDMDLQEMLVKIVRELERMQRKTSQEAEKKLEDHRSTKGGLEQAMAVLKEKKSSFQLSRMDMSKELGEIKKKFRQMEHSADELERIQSTLTSKSTELEALRASLDVEATQEAIDALKKTLKGLEAKEMELRAEKEKIDDNQAQFLKFESVRKDVETIEKELNRKLSRYARELGDIFDDDIPETKHLKSEFNRLCEKSSSEKDSLEADINTRKSQKVVLEKNESILQSDVKQMEAKCKTLEAQMSEVVREGEDLDETLEATKDKLLETRHDLQVKEANRFSFQEMIAKLDTMIQKGANKTSCPTCRRAFEETEEARELKTDLQKQIGKIPSKVKSIKDQLEQLDQRFEKLQKLHPVQVQRDELRTEIQRKKMQIKDIQVQIENHNEALSPSQEDLDKLVIKIEEQKDIREDIFKMDALSHDLERSKSELQDLERAHSDLKDIRSLDAFKKEEEKVHRDVRSSRKDVDKKETQVRDYHAKFHLLQANLNSLEKQRLEIQKQNQETSTLKAKEGEILEKLEAMKSDQSVNEEEIKNLQDELQDVERRMNKAAAERDSAMAKATDLLNKANQIKEQVLGIFKQINVYQASDNEKTSSLLKSSIQELNRRKESLDKKLADLKQSQREIQDLLMNQGNRQELKDNLTVRQYEEVIKTETKEVKRYRDQLDKLKYQDLSREKDELIRQYNEIVGQSSYYDGQKARLKEEILEIQRSLKSEKYGQAEGKFREASVRMRCRQHAIDDLKKYTGALELAISQYHKEKMGVINAILKEYWRTTYKGNDIDYIKIQTDEPKETASVTARRKVNYKVIMVKNNAEMEMRGRCSAGQKVLAALLIRLALAETFSSNCGIIALDEPTTNLDKDNIEALTEALGDIVQKRSQGAGNFQLLIITHDDDLIQNLGQKVPDVKHYYRVSRTAQSLSKVKRMPLHRFLSSPDL